MLLELHFIACKVSTSWFFFFAPKIMATTLLDTFKENNAFLAVNFSLGKIQSFSPKEYNWKLLKQIIYLFVYTQSSSRKSIS